MAQRVQIILEDDLTGGEAEETHAFTFDGKAYEIDLSAANSQQFRGVMAPYIAAARKVTGRSNSPKRTTSSGSSSRNPKEIRAWAAENGIEVPSRGRIPAEVEQKYAAAH